MELPNPPFYRRWSFILASVIVLAAIAAVVGWRGLQEVAAPATTTTTPVTSTTLENPSTTAPQTSLESTSRPDNVLWEASGDHVTRSEGFRAPPVWRIEWAFDCPSFRKLGGGNFKITGDGAFSRIQIQEFDVEASGTRTFTRGGFGHLLVDSVCDRWTVRVLAA